MTGATNFTLQDAVGSVVAVVGFVPVLYAPGYVVAFATNLFGFRKKSFTERSIWSIATSFAAAPIAAYSIGKFTGLSSLCWLLLALTAAAVALLFISRTNSITPRTTREKGIVAAAIALWIVFVIGSLVDLQIGHKLYFSVVLFDQSYRTAFTDAVVRTGIPPANPLYFAGQPQPMHYYYFWYVLCACVVRIAHVTARQAFIAGSIWAGFGLVSILWLYMRYFFEAASDTRRKTWIAIALLAVTGADLLPAIGSIFAQPALNGEMEWWSIDQISSWQDSLLWVPHHTAALLCCLFAFLLLWHIRRSEPAQQRWLSIALAATGFASSFGLSVYLAFGFALLMAAWLLRLLIQRVRDTNLIQNIVLAGLFSALILAPFLLEMTGGTSTQSGSVTHVFALSIRRMIDPELITSLPFFATLQKAHPIALDQAFRIILLLPGLALELGVYGAVLILLLLAKRKAAWQPDEARDTAIYLSLCGLGMVAFIRSSVITNNDFGYRAALLPQFFLLLLAAQLLASWWTPVQGSPAPKPSTRRLVYALLILGAVGTLYQAIMLRAFLPLEGAYPGTGFSQLPEDALEARRAFASLDSIAPANAVIAFNPVDPTGTNRGDVVPPFQFYQRTLLMDANRQILNAEPACAIQFGGDSRSCTDIQTATTHLYAADAPLAEAAIAACQKLGVSYLVATHLDAAWTNRSSWVWTLPTVAAQPGIRILTCSVASRSLDTAGKL